MSITDSLILLSFIVGLIPSLMLLVLYGLRTAWNATVAGRAVFYLVAVTAASYTLTTVTLLFPEIFRNEAGEWFRIVGRVAIASVLWNLLRLFFRAQGIGQRKSRQIPDKEQEKL